MTIKINENILKFRKEHQMTQSQVAAYLGVSPQAVSKWEKEGATPDIYLIPKIAFLFNISIDTLFGTTSLEKVDILVSKYETIRNDKNYREAKEAVEILLEMNDDHLKAWGLLCHLEHQRAVEYLLKSKKAAESLLLASEGRDDHWHHRAKIQLMRNDAILGNFEFVEMYKKKFKHSKVATDFNDYLVALGKMCEFEKIIRLGKEYINIYNDEEQGTVYPNLLNAALILSDLEYGKRCFDKIIELNQDKHQIFNAWWLLWKLYKKLGHGEDAKECKEELIRQLPLMGLNGYKTENLKKHLEELKEKPITIL